MKFGDCPLDHAEGAILAHATQVGKRRLKKGHHLTAQDISDLREAGISAVIAARLEPGDVDENAAAGRLASALCTSGLRAGPATTGRVNLFADQGGVFTVDAAIVDAINTVDPSVTIATLKPFERVEAGQMVATVKIIPFAVSGAILDRAVACAGKGEICAVKPFSPMTIGLVQTELPTVKASVLEKTRQVTDARLSVGESHVAQERRVPHRSAPLASAIRELAAETDMVLVFGASAVVDPRDVVPDAIRAAGGTVDYVGMPVDPGNLLVLGHLDGKPVIGAPGCARSPKENGFDWVLDRIMAGLAVTPADIAGMGVGGLLMEIATRPQPRDPKALARSQSVAAILLAAGRSSRMGANKLLATFDGVPLLRRSAETALASGASPVVVVLGHMAEEAADALDGLDVVTTVNEDYASGLASSLKAGLEAVGSNAAGAMVLLADMPALVPGDLDALIAAFHKAEGRAVVRATVGGRRGNPVILPRSAFAAVRNLSGDIGARRLVEELELPIIDVEIGEAAGIDVDTPEALARAGGVMAS